MRSLTGAVAAGALLALSGCAQPTGDQPVDIAWDRDTCAYCRMVISDRAFAAEAWGGEGSAARHYKFDDVGCLVNWLDRHAWPAGQARLWVADHQHRDQVHWLDARTAHYHPGQATPMDYGFGASAEPGAGTMSFEQASALMRAREKGR